MGEREDRSDETENGVCQAKKQNGGEQCARFAQLPDAESEVDLNRGRGAVNVHAR